MSFVYEIVHSLAASFVFLAANEMRVEGAFVVDGEVSVAFQFVQ